MEVESRRERSSIREGHCVGVPSFFNPAGVSSANMKHMPAGQWMLPQTAFWSACSLLGWRAQGGPSPQPKLVGVVRSPVWHSRPAWLQSHHRVEMWLALLLLPILDKEQLPAPLRMSDLRPHNQQPRASLAAHWSRVCLGCKRHGFDPLTRKIPWRRKWQPTPVFLPGKSCGKRSLVGYSPCGLKESDTT